MSAPKASERIDPAEQSAGRYARVHGALMESDPACKCAAAAALWRDWQTDALAVEAAAEPPTAVPVPGRPTRPRLVAPRELPRRGLGTQEGRAALVHAVAHIEFNAVNLALDAVYRFRELPDYFAGDWLRIAAEEARHFGMVRDRLQDLGCDYGDYPAHNGLWEMACKTDRDPLLRMALVPRVLEARGLDVTPGMIERLSAAGDLETVAVLEVILREEVGHVAAGSRWYAELCRARGLEPEATFRELVREHAPGHVQGPLHAEARLAAGFSAAELDGLESLRLRRD